MQRLEWAASMAVNGTYHQRESLAELVRTRARARGVRAGQLSLLVCAVCALTYLVQHPRAGSSKVLEVVLGSANHGYREKVEGLESTQSTPKKTTRRRRWLTFGRHSSRCVVLPRMVGKFDHHVDPPWSQRARPVKRLPRGAKCLHPLRGSCHALGSPPSMRLEVQHRA